MIKIATSMVNMSGINTIRVNNPKKRKPEQRTSAQIVRANDTGGVTPSGSGQVSDFSAYFASFGHPCVNMRHATVILNNSSPKSVAKGLVLQSLLSISMVDLIHNLLAHRLHARKVKTYHFAGRTY
jgi:hypothetical protein